MSRLEKPDKLTSKVNRVNVGRYQDTPAPHISNENDRVKISTKGPLYPAAEVLVLLEREQLNLWTRKCQRDVTYNLNLDIAGAAEIVRDALTHGQYIDSEWCVQNPSGPIAACDAYKLKTRYFNEAAKKELSCEYYVKFAIAKSGKLLLLVSCHV